MVAVVFKSLLGKLKEWKKRMEREMIYREVLGEKYYIVKKAVKHGLLSQEEVDRLVRRRLLSVARSSRRKRKKSGKGRGRSRGTTSLFEGFV